MKTLIQLENTFQNFLLHDNQDILDHVIGTNKVPVEVRLGIYGNAYRARLHEALMSSYSVLQDLLGYEQFEELCYAYIDAYPSHFRSIRWFGDQLAVFLKKTSPYDELPYLAELAEFEWTMASVFDAPDDKILQLEDMQNIPPEAWMNMRLQAHPSVRRLSLSWNVVPIWQALSGEQEPDDPQHSPSNTEWLLWRHELICQFSSLSEDEAWALDAMINQTTFGEICEGLCQWIDEENAGMHAASLLKGWITSGVISRIQIETKKK